jgi:hypothetical protein
VLSAVLTIVQTWLEPHCLLDFPESYAHAGMSAQQLHLDKIRGSMLKRPQLSEFCNMLRLYGPRAAHLAASSVALAAQQLH